MPSKRRQFLWTLPTTAIGFAGCSSLTPTDQGNNRTTTPASQGELQYEPTTPAENDRSGTPTEHPEYVVQTPITIFIRNDQNESKTVALILEMEPPSEDSQEVLNRSYDVGAKESIQIGEFEQNGQYHFTAETSEQQFEDSTYVSMRHLADCNYIRAVVVFRGSSITLGGVRTQQECLQPPATATPTPNDDGNGS